MTKLGRKPDLERIAWSERYNLTAKQTQMLRHADLDQLCHCRSEEARRIILGISK